MGDDMPAGRRNPVLMDASSAIILFKCSFFEPVIKYFNIIMAESVYSEITREDREGAGAFICFRKEERIHIHDNVEKKDCSQGQFQPLKGLGSGEQDTIRLYQMGIGDMIILNDGKGASYCKKNDIPFINSLLVPRILHLGGLIGKEERNSAMKCIMTYGRYSTKIIEYAYGCGDETLAGFL